MSVDNPPLSAADATTSTDNTVKSPMPAHDRQSRSVAGGKVVPLLPEMTRAVAGADSATLSATVMALDGHVCSINRNLVFSVDDEVDRVIVRVYAADSGVLVRQIPTAEALDHARRLLRSKGLIGDARN